MDLNQSDKGNKQPTIEQTAAKQRGKINPNKTNKKSRIRVSAHISETALTKAVVLKLGHKSIDKAQFESLLVPF